MGTFNPSKKFADWVDEELKSRKKIRPIFSLHKYFARRSGRVFNWAISELEKEMGEGKTLTILDPMAGGGTIPWEGSMRGHNVIAADLNPLASLIQKGMFNPPDSTILEREINSLLTDAEKQIGHLFETKIGEEKFPILYRHFVREVECQNCPERFRLYPHTMFNRGRKRGKEQSESNKGDSWCPHCDEINLSSSPSVKCISCEQKYNSEQGTIRVLGKKSIAKCSFCGFDSKPHSLINGNTSLYLVGIEYRDGKEKPIKKPNLEDFEGFRRTHEIPPLNRISNGIESKRLLNAGFSNWSSIFTTNQLLAYDYLFRRTSEIEDHPSRHWIRLGISSTLEYQCALVSYNFKYRKAHHLFTHHAFPIPETGVEGNVIGHKRDGAGTVRNFLNSLIKVSKNINSTDNWGPKEKVEWGDVSVINGDSRQLTDDLPSVNVVITDPPYHDSIEYEELTNFFKAWWEQYFAEDYQDISWDEISESQATPTKEDPQQFSRILGEIFEEAYKKSEENAIMIFTFHDTNDTGWMELAEAIDNSGWLIKDFISIESEYKANIHLQDYDDPMDEDILFICGKNEAYEPPTRSKKGMYQHAWKVWKELYHNTDT